MAATIGDLAALKVYNNLLSHTRVTALEASYNNYLFYDKHISVDDNWSNEQFFKEVQAEGDLGQRMEQAFKTVLSKESKAVIIGSDCPEISASLIREAFNKLDFADLVIGPTHDGGYYLLGMKNLHQTLFQNMPWSTEKVFSLTRQKIIDAGLLFTLLPQLSDLDNYADLEQFPQFN